MNESMYRRSSSMANFNGRGYSKRDFTPMRREPERRLAFHLIDWHNAEQAASNLDQRFSRLSATPQVRCTEAFRIRVDAKVQDFVELFWGTHSNVQRIVLRRVSLRSEKTMASRYQFQDDTVPRPNQDLKVDKKGLAEMWEKGERNWRLDCGQAKSFAEKVVELLGNERESSMNRERVGRSRQSRCQSGRMEHRREREKTVAVASRSRRDSFDTKRTNPQNTDTKGLDPSQPKPPFFDPGIKIFDEQF